VSATDWAALWEQTQPPKYGRWRVRHIPYRNDPSRHIWAATRVEDWRLVFHIRSTWEDAMRRTQQP
jgi:hypothetical protein